jgi:hypothetical protein
MLVPPCFLKRVIFHLGPPPLRALLSTPVISVEHVSTAAEN